MTDQTNNNASTASAPAANESEGRPVINRAARLAAHLADRGVAGAGIEPRIGPSGRVPTISYQTATDTFIDRETGETFKASDLPNAVPGDNGEELSDDGRDLDKSWAQLGDEWDRMASKLNEVRYDQKTGAKSYVLNGPARERYMSEFQAFHQSMTDQGQIYARMKQQRANKSQAMAEAALASLEREAELDRRALEIADETEAKERAARILASRRRG